MIQKWILFFLLSFLLSLDVFSQTQESLFYIVSKNDTLSSIAIKSGPPYTALYGPGGRLDRLIQMNPQIKNPDHIQPGERIKIALQEAVTYVKSNDQVREIAQEEESQAPGTESESPKTETAPSETPTPETVIATSPQATDMKFGAKVSLSFTRINAEDPRNASSAVFTSELDPEIALYFSQPIFLDVDFYSEVRWTQNRFRAPTTGQSLEQPKPAINLYGLVQKNISPYLGLGFYFGLKDKIFSRAASLTSYTFDSATIPVVGLNIKYSFWSESNRQFGVNLNYGFLQSGKASAHEVQQGNESRVGVFLENKRGLYSFEQEIFVEKSQQNTNLVNQNETITGFLFKLGKSF